MPPSEPPRGTQSRAPRRPAPRPYRPTPTQIRSARAAQRAYVSQGRAVQRAARQQRTQSRVRAQQQSYVSQGRAVQRVANQQARQSRAARGDLGRPGPEHDIIASAIHALSPRQVYGGGPHPRRIGRGPTSRIAAVRGVSTASVRGLAGSVPGLAVREMGFAVAQKPSLALKLPGQLAKYAAGAPAGLVESVAHPRAAAGGALADYARRYGALARGDTRAFRERIKKEGIAPEVLDLAGATEGVGAVTGRVLQGAARAGKLGARLERVATVRPALRVSGNVVRQQEVSGNLYRNLVRSGVDRARARKMAQRIERGDAPVEDVLAASRGEVTFASRRRTRREQRKAIARERGATIARLKARQGRESQAAQSNLRSLSEDERRGFNFAMQFGATSPDAARALLRRRARDIAAHREAHPNRTISTRRDQLPELQFLHDNAERVFTPKLRKVVREEQARERRLNVGDPGVDPVQAQLRRHQPLAIALGMERSAGETDGQWLRRLRTVAREVGLERPGYVRSEERPAGVFGSFALGGGARGVTEIPKRYQGKLLRQGTESLDPEVHVRGGVARPIKRSEQWNMVARNFDRHALTEIPDSVRALAERRAQALREHQDVLAAERRSQEAAHELDPKAVQEELGHLDEQHAALSEQAANAQRALGNARTPEARAHFAQHVHELRHELATIETQAARLKGHLDGSPRRQVQRQVEDSVARIEKSRRKLEEADRAIAELGKPARNRSIVDLQRDLENAGVDLNTVAFWNPRKFRELAQQAARDTEGADVPGDPAHLGDQAMLPGSPTDLQRALSEAVIPGDRVKSGNPEDFRTARGYSVVPREVLDELTNQVAPSPFKARAFDIAKGKLSRSLLGNPGWLMFQTGSNVLLSGLAGAGPITWAKAAHWWRGLSDAEREGIAPEVGIHGWFDDQTHLGATTTNGPEVMQRLVNGWQALKRTGPWQVAHKGNPLDLIFRADNAQNNFFRKAVLYKSVNREAYRRLGDNAARMARGEQRIMRVFRRAPEQALREALSDPKMFEHHARAVRDFLGDYTSYTAKERKVLGRYALFYGFLRHSLRLTLYTLPVKHPLITAIGLELGKLHDDELRRIFGVAPPVWEQANAYVKVGGGIRKFDISRLNPFFNAIDYQGPQSLLQIGSPFLSMLVDQAAKKNVLFDQPWKVDSSGSELPQGQGPGVGNRLQILLEQTARLSPYYRLAEKTGVPGVRAPLRGTQGADSSLFFPQPTRYKSPAALAANQQRIREQERAGAGGAARAMFLPFTGEPAGPTIRSSRDYALRSGKTGPAAPPPPGAGDPLSDPAIRRAVDAARQAQTTGSPLDDPEIRRALDAVRGGG